MPNIGIYPLVVMPIFFFVYGVAYSVVCGRVHDVRRRCDVLVASVGGKLSGVHVTGRMLRWRSGEVTIISWVLQAKALIKIVVANILLDRPII